MQGAWIKFALALSLCLVAPAVRAEDAESATPRDHVTEKDRVWANYTREAAVVGKGTFRFAVSGMAINQGVNDNNLDLTGFPLDDFEERLVPPDEVKGVSGGRFDVVGSYGLGPLAEVGFDMPFFVESISFKDREDPADGKRTSMNTGAVGDLVLYGHVRKMLSNATAGGLGLEITAPTGNERKRLGTGETAFNPFASLRHNFGRIAIGGHAGYQLYTGTIPDVFNWSAYGLTRLNEQYAIRLEVSGRLFKYRGDFYDDVSLLPGLDFDLTEHFTIRPQATVGLTGDAFDWGIGVGLVVTL